MGFIQWLGSKIAPKSRKEMDEANAALEGFYGPDSDYWKAADLGLGTPHSEANQLLGNLAKVQYGDVTANYGAMDRDNAELHRLGSVYQQMFEHGGLAEKAATNRAVATLADAGGGGAEGVARFNQDSQEISKNATDVGNAERTQAGSAANANSLQAGMLELQKAAFQAALTHANIQKNLEAKSIQNALLNKQTDLGQTLQGAQVQAEAVRRGISQDAKNTQSNLGFQLIGAGAQAAAGGLAAGVQAFSGSGRNSVAPTVSNAELDKATLTAYERYGIDPPATAFSSYDAAHQELMQNQAIISALTSRQVSYPGVAANAGVLTSKDAYPTQPGI